MTLPSVELGTVAAVERKSVKPDEIESHLSYVGLENVTADGTFVEVAPAGEAVIKSNKFAFSSEHILYGKLRPYLSKIAAPQFGGVCSTDIVPIRPGPDIDRRFLVHVLRTPAMVGHASRLAVGANLPRLSPKSLETFPIPLPPMEEQRRIAAVLDAADELRAKRREALAKLESLSEAIFIDGVSRLGPDVPLDGHIAFLTSGARGWARYYTGSGPRFVRSLDVQMNAIGGADVVCVDPPDSAEAKRIRVQDGDVLLTITGSRIGRAAVAPPDLDGAYISQHVAILRTTTSSLLPGYLTMWLTHPMLGQRQITARQYGQTKPGLNFDQIRAFELAVPSIDDQRRIMECIARVRRAHGGMWASRERLSSLFSSLQQRAFRGEL